jgi:uncharacterized RDD family membrane protein YckC
VSILPLPDLTPEISQAPANNTVSAPENIHLHLSSLEAYTGQPGALAGVSFWPRVGARVIDSIVHYLVAVSSGFVFGVMLAIVASLRHNPRPLTLVGRPNGQLTLVFFSLVGMIALETICEGVHGSTLGKLLLGFVVVQEDGTPCRVRSAFIRSLAYFVDGLFFGLIAYFAMQKTPQEQRHGDDWAHTIVCRRAQVTSPNLRGFGQFAMVFLLALMADATLMITGLLIKILA